MQRIIIFVCAVCRPVVYACADSGDVIQFFFSSFNTSPELPTLPISAGDSLALFEPNPPALPLFLTILLLCAYVHVGPRPFHVCPRPPASYWACAQATAAWSTIAHPHSGRGQGDNRISDLCRWNFVNCKTASAGCGLRSII